MNSAIIDQARKFRLGVLTEGNVDAVAHRIEELLTSGHFSISTAIVRENGLELEVQASCDVCSSWVDGNTAKVRVNHKGATNSDGHVWTSTSIGFSAGSYFYGFEAKIDGTPFRYSVNGEVYVKFKHDQVEFRTSAMDGSKQIYIFALEQTA